MWMWIQGLAGGSDCHCFLFLSNFILTNDHPNLQHQKSHLWLYFVLEFLFLPWNHLANLLFMGYSLGHSFPKGLHIAQYFGDLWDWAADASSWLGTCMGLLCGFCFFGFDCVKPISLHEFRMVSLIYLSRFREFVYIGSGKGCCLASSYGCSLRSEFHLTCWQKGWQWLGFLQV